MTHRDAAITLAALACIGCAAVRPVQDPARFITDENPTLVYVTHANRAVVAIANPHLSGDTLYGTWADQRERRFAVPLSQVRRVDARQRHGGRTALLLAGSGTVAAVAIFALLATDSGEPLVCDYARWPPRCET